MDNFIVWAAATFVVLAALYVVENVYRFWKTSRGKKRIPYLRPVPLLGNTLYFSDVGNMMELHARVRTYLPDQPLVGLWLGPQLLVSVNDPKYIDALIAKVSHKSEEMYSVFDVAVTGVFSTRDIAKWGKLRKPLNGFLKQRSVDFWMNKFSEQSTKIIGIIEKKKGLFDIEPVVWEATINSLCETQLGTEDSDVMGITDSYFEHLRNLLDCGSNCLFMRLLDVLYRIDFLYFRSSKWKALEKSLNIVLQPFCNLLKNKREFLESNHLDITTMEPSSYLDVVLQMATNEQLNEKDSARLGLDLFIAGSDTTSGALSSALLFLAMYPHYQHKVYEELNSIFDDTKTTLSPDDLKNLKFMEMVINETLRLAGPPSLARKLTKDMDVGDYLLPKNTIISFALLNAGRDERYWEKPNEFYPEHFLPEAVAARPKGAFLPFSGGSRGCPGKTYAMIAIKTTLAPLLRRFEFTTEQKFEDLKFKMGFMQGVNGVFVEARPRKNIS